MTTAGSTLDIVNRRRRVANRLKQMPPQTSGGVTSRMSKDDLAVLHTIRKLYQSGDISHLSWNQIFQVAQEDANFPGKIGALKTFMLDRTEDGKRRE